MNLEDIERKIAKQLDGLDAEQLQNLYRRSRVGEFATFIGLAVVLIAVLLAGPTSTLAVRLIVSAWALWMLLEGVRQLRWARTLEPLDTDFDPELERLKAVGYFLAGAAAGVGAWVVAL